MRSRCAAAARSGSRRPRASPGISRARGSGHDAGGIRVPIVPAAVIFDLAIGEVAWPDVEAGRRAAAAASGDPPAQGCAGAGTGATVGKVLGPACHEVRDRDRERRHGLRRRRGDRRRQRGRGRRRPGRRRHRRRHAPPRRGRLRRLRRARPPRVRPAAAGAADDARGRRDRRAAHPSSRPTTSPPSPTTASPGRSGPFTRCTTATRSSRSRPGPHGGERLSPVDVTRLAVFAVDAVERATLAAARHATPLGGLPAAAG